jgi:predicted Zn-dependent peptidase
MRRTGPGMFMISATVRPGKDPREIESLISEEVAKLYSAPITDKELGRVRVALKRSAVSRITVLGKANALADDAALYNDPNRINTEIPKELGITPADVQAAAKKLLVTANRVVVETRPSAGSARPARKEN